MDSPHAARRPISFLSTIFDWKSGKPEHNVIGTLGSAAK
jgi:hypothetical protein